MTSKYCPLKHDADNRQQSSSGMMSRSDLYIMTIEEPVVEKTEALYYFEEFCIQPMRLNLSFVRTEKLDDSDAR